MGVGDKICWTMLMMWQDHRAARKRGATAPRF